MNFEQEPKHVVLLPWKKPDPLSPPDNQVRAAFADRYLNHMEQLDIKSPSTVVNLTNIMVTVANSEDNVNLVQQLVKSGANILRIPTHSRKIHELKTTVKQVKRAIEELSLSNCMVETCAVAMETQGSQIRTGQLARPINVDPGDEAYAIQLTEDSNIVLTSDPLFENKSNMKRLFVTSPDLAKRVVIDDVIYLNGRDIHLKVTEKQNDAIHCVVTKGGKLRDHQLLTAQGVTLNLPVLSERDTHVIDLVLSENLDMIILSTLRNADTIREVRTILREGAEKVLIIAKIETLPSMEYIDDIIAEADGVLLDRTHLAAATSIDVAFLAQKMIGGRCHKQGKPFLVTGNILSDQTIKSYDEVKPADMNDVLSMVQDGADVLVLSQSEQDHLSKIDYSKEQGNSRVEIFKNMLRIAESALWSQQIYNDLTALAYPPLDPAHSIAIACVNTSLKCQAAAIIVVTCSGYSAKLISRYRPQCPILAVSSLGYVCRHLNMYRNIKPLHYIRKPQADWAKDVDCRIQFAIQHGMEINIINPGDPLVLINGWRRGAGFTNIMRVVYAPIENMNN